MLEWYPKVLSRVACTIPCNGGVKMTIQCCSLVLKCGVPPRTSKLGAVKRWTIVYFASGALQLDGAISWRFSNCCCPVNVLYKGRLEFFFFISRSVRF